MDDPVIPFDLGRMILGEHPALFYAEIAVRTVLIYGYTLALIRWIGGRSVAQLSMVDLLLVIALGSAVGDATFYPDVPLLQAMLVITLIVGLNKALDRIITRSDRAKRLIDGRAIAVVTDGRILCDALAQRDLSPLEIKAMLRLAGIANLGQVDTAFLEAGGALSVFRRQTPAPGLPLVPPLDVADPPALDPASDGPAACINCGTLHPVAQLKKDTPCPGCHLACWTPARTPSGIEPGVTA